MLAVPVRAQRPQTPVLVAVRPGSLVSRLTCMYVGTVCMTVNSATVELGV